MYNVVKIGSTEVPMQCMASTDVYYRTIFHEDPIKLMTRPDLDGSVKYDFMMKMGFIMAKFAELHNSADMNRLTEDDYLDWLSQFEREDYQDALGDISETYSGQMIGEAEAKKKEDAPIVS